MEARSLESLVLKHFDFLSKDYGFEYNSDSNFYFRNKLKIEIQHENAELNLMFVTNQKSINFVDVMSQVLQKKFTYPEHFSPWVLSMGDVDSRLAYDAKLMKEYAQELLVI